MSGFDCFLGRAFCFVNGLVVLCFWFDRLLGEKAILWGKAVCHGPGRFVSSLVEFRSGYFFSK